jgi:hypothetical protein
MFGKAYYTYHRYILYREYMMVRVKTSIYVDRKLWERFKRYALKKGVEVSRLLEGAMEEELVEDALEEELLRLSGPEDYELDFEPIKPRKPVSDLIRVMRDERRGILSGQQRHS